MKSNVKKYELVWENPKKPKKTKSVSAELLAALEAGSAISPEPYIIGKMLQEIPNGPPKDAKFYGVNTYRELSQLGSCYYDYQWSNLVYSTVFRGMVFGDSTLLMYGKRINGSKASTYRHIHFSNKLFRFVRS